jgi:hypothetical protein
VCVMQCASHTKTRAPLPSERTVARQVSSWTPQQHQVKLTGGILNKAYYATPRLVCKQQPYSSSFLGVTLKTFQALASHVQPGRQLALYRNARMRNYQGITMEQYLRLRD